MNEWGVNLGFMCGGLLVLGAALAVRGELKASFLFFVPNRGMESMLHWCSRMLVGWSLAFSGILTSLYVAGSIFDECGESSSRITISYLSGAVDVELCFAVFRCAAMYVCIRGGLFPGLVSAHGPRRVM